MTRLQRKRRRRWQIAAGILLGLFLVEIVLLIMAPVLEKSEAEPQAVEPVVEQMAHTQPAKTLGEIKAEIAMRSDHPNRFYYRQEIPLDKYLQETLYNAATEWGVPYELAVAVCWRETNFQNLVTVNDTGTYYGMMAVQLESAGWYMEQCGVEHLNSEEERIRVGCCILGAHIRNYGVVRGLMAYNAGSGGAAEQWAVGVTSTAYTMDVLNYMEGLLE